jgi:hydroxyacylglutathione hydrolase
VPEVAPDVHQTWVGPRHGINQYLLGEVLVDAGVPHCAERILRRLGGRAVRAHALTHAHPDHFGSSAEVCARLGIELWAPDADADAVETGRLPAGPHPLGRLLARLPAPPAHPVARRLREGDEVGGFTVLETPGHSPGHVSYWRASDRVLVVGDAAFNRGVLDPRPGLREPPALLTHDVARNRAAIRRLAALEPALALFGHGPPLRDRAQWAALAAALPG